jgi:hypothetical protein
MTLSGECADEVLQGLVVGEVLPAPSAGRLLVRVMLRAEEGGPGVVEVLQRLEGVMGLLRARVGEGIVRKRTPELVFEIIPYRSAGGSAEEMRNAEEEMRNAEEETRNAEEETQNSKGKTQNEEEETDGGIGEIEEGSEGGEEVGDE